MSPKRKKGDLVDVRQVLEDVLTTEGFKRPYSRICVSWKDLVGEKIAEHSIPARLDRKILHVRVENSVWANELMTRRH